jgi:hypothetical protein
LVVQAIEDLAADFDHGVPRRGTEAKQWNTSRMQNFVHKGISPPPVCPFMGAVVQFNGEKELGRRVIAENEVEVLLRDGAERTSLIATDWTSHHIGKPHFAHDETVGPDGGLERPEECHFAARKKRGAPSIGECPRVSLR